MHRKKAPSPGRSQFPSLSERPSNLKVFTFSELKQATKNFSRTTKLGEGGFGCVFKGIVKISEDPAQKIDVAVKQLGRRGLQARKYGLISLKTGSQRMVTEVNVLGVVEHPNLVKLVGYCAEDDERGIQRLLIYEYMPNGSVEDHLSAKSVTPLPWAMRLRIALDAARGLAYLHEEMDFQIIFRDFKSSNILLDEQWNAKLSDFGLARLGPPEGLTHVSTAVVGTMGYAAPEYIQTGRLTSKSDVWSYDAKKFQQILDPRLEGKQVLKSAHKLSLVANRCLARLQKTRPKMSEVLEMVNQVVEGTIGAGNPQPPLMSKEQKKKFEEPEAKGKRRIADMKIGDGSWIIRVWSSKLVKTC
ncbi:UNVERIFIED_CONTAM: Serine/threonine-protein kinase PCRK1 [Sesamum angustifolium]|uniref:non-specific serine/threonine protein kinase n=1 Tax=Sesamum angustifolium TaxID=2727405 RepID=A0AAW2N7N4_9LAMI